MWIWVVTVLVGGSLIHLISKYKFANKEDAQSHLEAETDNINAYMENIGAEGMIDAEIVYKRNDARSIYGKN